MTANQQTTTRVAAIGVGYWGKNLVRNFAELGSLAALADPDRDAAAALAGKYRVPVLDWQAVLNDSAIDGVAIAAPAGLHARLAQEALLAGKHVFVEKPLALAVNEAEALTRLAERQDRRLMVGHLLQYHPAFTALRDLVREGALGRLQYIYSNRLNLGKVRREEDILWSFAPHDISMILSLIGQEPVRVTAEGGYYLHNAIADVTTTHLAFAGGDGRTSTSPGCIPSRSRSSWSSATREWRCSMTPSPGRRSCCSIPTASNGARRCRCRIVPRRSPSRSRQGSRCASNASISSTASPPAGGRAPTAARACGCSAC
jgi:predicted dehydrogenase